jgi:hypothetical protein
LKDDVGYVRVNAGMRPLGVEPVEVGEHEVRVAVGAIGGHQPAALRLQRDFEAKRRAVSDQLLNHLRDRLSETDRRQLDRAFRDLQDEFLRSPLSAIRDDAASPAYTLTEALSRLFGLLPTMSPPAE